MGVNIYLEHATAFLNRRNMIYSFGHRHYSRILQKWGEAASQYLLIGDTLHKVTHYIHHSTIEKHPALLPGVSVPPPNQLYFQSAEENGEL